MSIILENKEKWNEHHFSYHNVHQERKWLSKAGQASSIGANPLCLVAPSILPQSGRAIAHPAHLAITPLFILAAFSCFLNLNS